MPTPEDSTTGEFDLSKIDSLLNDLEKDLPNIQAGATVTTEPQPAARDSEAFETDAHEILGLPVRPTEKDDPPDDLDDMFTTEKETLDTAQILPDSVAPHMSLPAHELETAPAAVIPSPPDRQIDIDDVLEMEEEKPKPPPVREPPAAAGSEKITPEPGSFEDMLELDEEALSKTPTPPAAMMAGTPQAPPPQDTSFEEALEMDEGKLESAPVPVAAEPPPSPPTSARSVSIENFQQFLKDKNYTQAVQTGKSLISKNSPVAMRINLAGAMFCAGHREEAEQELLDILEQNPFNIPARRNLEIVRAEAACPPS